MELNNHHGGLFLTVYKNNTGIGISRAVIRKLGCPRYITLKINKKLNSIAIFPCNSRDYMSFKVPEQLFVNPNVKMKICSKGFIAWMNTITNRPVCESYLIEGEYSSRNNLVYFPMKPREDIMYS